MSLTGVHHSAICTSDVNRALSFWRDGMGLEEMFDLTFAGNWSTLFGSKADSLRSVFLGDPEHPDAGIVELVVFETPEPGRPISPSPALGFFLLSFQRDVDRQLATLADLGFTDGVQRILHPAGDGTHLEMAVIAAPDGVLVELIGEAR